MKKIVQLAVAVISTFSILLFNAGCASNVDLKVSNEQRDVVYIDPEVIMTDEFTYRGLWDSAMQTSFGTLLGYQTAQSMRLSASSAITQMMEKYNIHVNDIMVDALEAELKSSSLFKTVSRSSNEYPKLKVEIEFYGLLLNLGIADSRLKPYMDVTATLEDSHGDVLWRKRDYVSNASSNTTPLPLETYMNEPKYLKEAFEKASQLIAKGLVTHMRHE